MGKTVADLPPVETVSPSISNKGRAGAAEAISKRTVQITVENEATVMHRTLVLGRGQWQDRIKSATATIRRTKAPVFPPPLTSQKPRFPPFATKITMPVASTSSLLPTGSSSENTRLAVAIPRPIPNSYWATEYLLATEYPWAPCAVKQKLDAVLLAGIRTFIDLTEVGELRPYAPNCLSARAEFLGIDPGEIEYHNFPIADRSLPVSVEYMCGILDVLRDNERRERISAVHCRGGIGRTGMVVGCWLVECGLARTGEEALNRIAEEWKTVEKCKRFPHSPETGPQFEFVRNFQKVARISCH
ncbi:hypothetical protein PLICRDRAFT_43852 [Plicaturopsis crispa FD-325 SS-3]|nr:hypothetical protein PLICRDRAFT_43852 [Plicaturopsis crispa FD-325 SS-3]